MSTGTGYGTPSSSPATSGNGYGTPSGSPTGDDYGTPKPTPTPTPTDDQGDNVAENSFDSITKIKLSLKSAIKSKGNKGKELIGTDSPDTIVSGKGVDTMVGLDGADYFVYKQKNNFGKKKADKVTDFDAEDGDKIVIKGKSFSKGTKKEATFAEAANKKQAKKLAKQDVDFIYEKKTGKLYFNSNGDKKGFGDKGGYFGILEGSPEITSDDINLI